MARKLKVGDYVNQKKSTSPTGVIEYIDHDIALVRWGHADGKVFKDSFRLDELKRVKHEIIKYD